MISHDIMNSIDNLEYLERINLNRHSTEDKLLFKYKNEIEGNEKGIERNDNCKRVIKYLKSNNISEIIIDNNKPIIFGYPRHYNNNINLEALKNAISKDDMKY